MQNEKVIKVYDGIGFEIFKLPFDKFKTNTITIYFQNELSNEDVAKNALVPAVLRQGCKNFPTRKEISKKLQELYGAIFDCGITKKGDRQMTYFYIETLKDKYTAENEKLWDESFELLFQIITEPYLENNTFSEEYISIEKSNIIKLIEGRLNDKASYAYERCIEEMFKDEVFSIYEYGRVSDYDNISAQDVTLQHKKLLSSSPISIYLSGYVDNHMIEMVKSKFSNLNRNNIKELNSNWEVKSPLEVKYIEENLNITQGKICMGFRTNVDPANSDYYSLIVYNSILGGGIHSKLFQNVREKEGLAYYSFSRVERFKGIMVLSSGIEISNKDKVVDIMNKQLEEIKNGNISDYEFNSAKKSIESSINSMKDSQISLVDFNVTQNILGTNETLDSVLEKLNAVSKEDVIKISNKITPDTIYFLTGTSKEIEGGV